MNMTGVWLGQTMSHVSSETIAIHVWIIAQRGDDLLIYTNWLGLEERKAAYRATISQENRQCARIHGTNRMMLIRDDHVFIVRDWVAATNEVVNKRESLSVYFQRRDRGLFARLINGYITMFRNSPAMLRLLNR
jgi:hypothetical protein